MAKAPCYIRIRHEKDYLILESIHKSEDHTDIDEWSCIKMIRKERYARMTPEVIQVYVEEFTDEMNMRIHSGMYEEYPLPLDSILDGLKPGEVHTIIGHTGKGKRR